MQTKVNLLTNNDCYRAAKPLRPTGIVVHSTGSDQKRISAYTEPFNHPGVDKCVHGFLGLDDKGILTYEQTLPYYFRCWGCGSGIRGSYNASHIQFEICETLNDRAWCRETFAAALDLCEKFCREYDISPENVVCHSEAHARGYASNHADVMHWWPKHGLSMDGFRAELRKRLEEDDDMAPRFKTLNDVPDYLRKETQELIQSGALKGGDSGLDVTMDMLRTMIISKRYADQVAKNGK